ncbi:MAG: S-layer homology domain-containing protein [Clostridia bacterium]|nr:S-layer homology domain-containing protein [Clostridia bacterium]
MSKKIVSVILSLCIIVCALPMNILAAPEQNETLTFNGGKTLLLQNDYISFYFYDLQYQTYTATVPRAIAKETGDVFTQDLQAPGCEFNVYTGGGNKKTTYPSVTLQKAEFVSETPNGKNTAIKADYNMDIGLYDIPGTPYGTIIPAKVTVYHELVCLDKKDKTAWGVLTTVGNIQMNSDALFGHDFYFEWWYVINSFTGMGHGETANSPGGPAIKLDRTTVTESGEKTTKSSVVTGKIDDMSTKHVPKGYTSWGDIDGVYVNEIYTDAYPWANPFVGLSDYYDKFDIVYCGDSPLRVSLPQTVTVKPNDFPVLTWVESKSYCGFDIDVNTEMSVGAQYLWGYRNLKTLSEELPTKPDEISSSFSAKRLAVFESNGAITVEYVSDDAALESLKKKYNASPVAQIAGEYKSTNGSSFEFTGGAATLSPSVTATWNENNGGKLIVYKDGRIEQHGVNLNAPSFKFYQPRNGAEDSLKITMSKEGLSFDIEPDKNDAVIFVDIPYATTKLEKATTDADGNLVFNGEIGFKTVFDGAEFSLEKLGYGLEEKTVNGKKKYEFKVNGVKAKGSFDTADLMALELAKVEGEVNTFKGEERYAFSLELNAFDLFETEAALALERSNNGALIPDELWFYVKSSPGIVLVPPVPIGQLNGGGAGFKDLAATVNGNYLAIPPIKLRGALTGTYLHLIEGTGNVIIGPSEISLKATDVNLVGAGAATQIVDSFGYSLKLNGQERSYKGNTYEGIYFGGSKELALNLPSKQIDVITFDSSIELGAFGGVNNSKDYLYLAIGANGTVAGRVQIPKSSPVLAGKGFNVGNINLIVGGQTAFPIRNVTVEEGMKQAFQNVDVYLGVVAEVGGWLASARAWVLVPKIVETDFRKGGGWDIEFKMLGYMPEWNWADKGVSPVVSMLAEDSDANFAAVRDENFVLANAGVSRTEISASAGTDEAPYIVLAFDGNLTEEQIKDNLKIFNDRNAELNIDWMTDDSQFNPDEDVSATTIADMEKTNADGKKYRLALLRLKEEGKYIVDAGELTFTDEKAFSVEPFEKLALTLNDNQISGKVKYAVDNAPYVIRTYFSNEEGGADYMISEQEISDTSNIELSVPSAGAIAPTGEYYVTAFLMTKKQADLNGDGKEEDALIAIDNQAFNTKVAYTNVNEPSAPIDVTLQTSGNEVMRAEWNASDNVDGYSVRIYEEKDGEWIDTGFGYDLDKDTTTVDMALTVGGNGVRVNENGDNAESVPAENLLPDKTYKVGVRAYKKSENGKYYSKETESTGEFLPKYTPMDIALSMNGNECTADENGVYHAYIGDGDNTLSVSGSDADATFKLTRMDTNDQIPNENGENTFAIPEFEGSLMFKIDGISGKDVTSVFLLINMDKEPPVLTLSSDIFYADNESGDYTITGISDAGSRIMYGDNEEVVAGNDGKFAVSGNLDESQTSSVIMLCAQDFAENTSIPQTALVIKKISNTVTVNDSYAENSGSGEYSEGETVTIKAGERSGYKFSGWTTDDSVQFADSKSAETTFTMPSKAVTVTANWTKSSGGNGGGGGNVRYTVSFETNGGNDIASKTVTRNSVIKEPETPIKDGFDFEGWYTDKGLKTKYDFTEKVTKNFTLYAKWTEKDNGEWKNPFTDVKENDWFYDSVKYAYENDLMKGISNTEFAPDSDVTRAMFVTVIYRMENEPQTGKCAFTDVESGSYYENAVAWTNENGIVSGISEDCFAPNEPITREQMAAIIYRYAAFKGYDITTSSNTSYTDNDNISDYAKDAVIWAAEKYVMTGNTDGSFAPKANTTRAQTASVFMRMVENLK